MQVLPGLLLLPEVDQAVDVQAGAHLLIKRVIEGALGQALQKLPAARQVIVMQRNCRS
ncbi:hypothetical protein D9M69_690940 [compost metagenome]